MTDSAKAIDKFDRAGPVVICSVAFGLSFCRALPATSDVTYFLSIGFDFKQVSTLNIFFTVAGLLFEVPTGWVADRYGRRLALAIAVISRGLVCLGVLATGSFPILCSVFVVLGLGAAAESGALSALAIDQSGKRDPASTILLLNRWTLAGTLAGALLGAAVANVDLRLPWLAALIASFATIVAVVLLREIRSGLHQTEPLAIPTTSLGPLRTILGSRPLVALLAFTMLSQFALASMIKFWQPAFTGVAGPSIASYFGVLYGAFILAQVAANRLLESPYLTSPLKGLVVGSLLSGVPIVLFAYSTKPYLAVALYLLHVFGDGLKDPLIATILHRNVGSSIRATCESWFAAVVGLAELGGFAAAGALADAASLQKVFLLSGAISCLAAVLVPFIVRPARLNYGSV